jgi:hypothetical protein
VGGGGGRFDQFIHSFTHVITFKKKKKEKPGGTNDNDNDNDSAIGRSIDNSSVTWRRRPACASERNYHASPKRLPHLRRMVQGGAGAVRLPQQ